MAIIEVSEQYYTYEGRLGSFQSAQPLSKRRVSNAHSKTPKSMKWPHSFLPAEEMAKAGFFHYPTQDSPDNTICFLCLKSIDGWEKGDEPQKEHLKHSPQCGWAIVASINAGDVELSEEYPLSLRMITARKDTFGDRWPHESKKGWKCKVKQLVDAGWKYTPTLESDDMATCSYCELGLDGWEPLDKPLDEHHKRSPHCQFFSLIYDHKQKSPPKKTIRARKPRASKALRLSTQSTFTITSEAPSFADTAAEEGDSVLTTATNATATSKAGKGKKAAVKGRKPKTKKEEPIEVETVAEPEDDDFSVKVEQPKITRGRKRASEATDGSTLLATQPPPAKRRATRTRGSIAIEQSSLALSVMEDENATLTASYELAPPKKGRKGRGSTAKSMRNVSSASTASKASLRMHAADDDNIDRMLEADLERPLTDEEDNTALVGRSHAGKAGNLASTAPVRKAIRGSKVPNDDHLMFGAERMEIDEAALDAELDAMEVAESKQLPKAKGAKGKQTRKPSAKQQAAARKAAEAESQVQIDAELQEQTRQQSANTTGRGTRPSAQSINESTISVMDNDDSGNETDASMASQSTVVRGAKGRRGSTLKKGKGIKKAVSRNIEEIVHKSVEVTVEEAPKKRPGNAKKVVHVEETRITEIVHYPDVSMSQGPSASEPAPKSQPVAKAKGKERTVPEPPVESQSEQVPALTPKRSTKELTPTPSPQSSDAENHPPSSKPSTIKAPIHKASRVLAASTPTQVISPSKRNVLAGLQTSNSWTPMNLDEIFASTPGQEKENYDILKEATEMVKGGKLTSLEKKMSVEEWILFNANLAEEKLRRECEGMVGVFEREGGRAMRVLEGIECAE